MSTPAANVNTALSSTPPTRPPSHVSVSPGRSASARLARAGIEVLARYVDSQNKSREVILLPGCAGSRLVIDRLVFRGLDARLVVHLAADEPAINARIAAELYLSEPSRGCRLLCEKDLLEPPFEPECRQGPHAGVNDRGAAAATRLTLDDDRGSLHQISLLSAPRGREARWLRTCSVDGSEQVVSVREVIGELERAAEVRDLTLAAIKRLRGVPGMSIATLAAELRRVDASPLVLNRALRGAVLAAVARREVSLSAIAMRCGRVKRDRRGRSSGETSWLARRVGLLPEGGCTAPTPWIHSDVLALIARRGLGIPPREVELG